MLVYFHPINIYIYIYIYPDNLEPKLLSRWGPTLYCFHLSRLACVEPRNHKWRLIYSWVYLLSMIDLLQPKNISVLQPIHDLCKHFPLERNTQCIHAARYGRTKHFATTARLRLDSFKPVNLSMTLWAFARFEPQWPWPGWHSIISCFSAYYINLSCFNPVFGSAGQVMMCWDLHQLIFMFVVHIG